MGRTKEVMNIDKKALKDYMIKNGYKLGELSVQLGFHPSYLSDVLREGVRKRITIPAYKYLCSILKVSEDKFILKDEPKEVQNVKAQNVQQPIVVNSGLTPEQFNALLQAISTLTDTISKALDKIAIAQNSNSVISGKIYGEMAAVANALGVITPTSSGKSQQDDKKLAIQPKYALNFGEKKNG